MKYELDENAVLGIIQTLKEIDVRGFDSMNRLVCLVILFENVLRNPVKEEQAPVQEPKLVEQEA